MQRFFYCSGILSVGSNQIYSKQTQQQTRKKVWIFIGLHLGILHIPDMKFGLRFLYCYQFIKNILLIISGSKSLKKFVGLF